MVCIAAFIILALIGVFVAVISIFKPKVGKAYWKMFKKAWGCLWKKVRLQKCETGFKEDVKNRCFDAEKGLYADTPEKTHFAQHAQIWAVLCGSNAFPTPSAAPRAISSSVSCWPWSTPCWSWRWMSSCPTKRKPCLKQQDKCRRFPACAIHRPSTFRRNTL